MDGSSPWGRMLGCAEKQVNEPVSRLRKMAVVQKGHAPAIATYVDAGSSASQLSSDFPHISFFSFLFGGNVAWKSVDAVGRDLRGAVMVPIINSIFELQH